MQPKGRKLRPLKQAPRQRRSVDASSVVKINKLDLALSNGHKLEAWEEDRGGYRCLVIRSLTGSGIILLPDFKNQITLMVAS